MAWVAGWLWLLLAAADSPGTATFSSTPAELGVAAHRGSCTGPRSPCLEGSLGGASAATDGCDHSDSCAREGCGADGLCQKHVVRTGSLIMICCVSFFPCLVGSQLWNINAQKGDLLWPLDSWGEIMNPFRSPASRFYSSPFLHHGGCGPRHWNAGARGRSTAGGLPPWVPTADAKAGHGLSSFAGSLWSEILHPCGCGLSVACWCFHMGAVRKSRSQIYELMRLLCFARLLKPASR